MKRKYTQEEVDRLMIGRFYCNSDDLNIFVRRKTGLYSWTMNMGNPWSWVITAAMLAVIWGLTWLLNV